MGFVVCCPLLFGVDCSSLFVVCRMSLLFGFRLLPLMIVVVCCCWLLLAVVGRCWLLLVVVGCCWLWLVVVGCC